MIRDFESQCENTSYFPPYGMPIEINFAELHGHGHLRNSSWCRGRISQCLRIARRGESPKVSVRLKSGQEITLNWPHPALRPVTSDKKIRQTCDPEVSSAASVASAHDADLIASGLLLLDCESTDVAIDDNLAYSSVIGHEIDYSIRNIDNLCCQIGGSDGCDDLPAILMVENLGQKFSLCDGYDEINDTGTVDDINKWFTDQIKELKTSSSLPDSPGSSDIAFDHHGSATYPLSLPSMSSTVPGRDNSLCGSDWQLLSNKDFLTSIIDLEEIDQYFAESSKHLKLNFGPCDNVMSSCSDKCGEVILLDTEDPGSIDSADCSVIGAYTKVTN